MPTIQSPLAVASASPNFFAGHAIANDPATPVASSSPRPNALSLGLERIANVPERLPREIFTKIASYLISNPKDVIALSALDKDCAENLSGERMFSKAILRIDNVDAEDLTLDDFGALLQPILHNIPQVRLAGDALLRLVVKMRFPATHGGGSHSIRFWALNISRWERKQKCWRCWRRKTIFCEWTKPLFSGLWT